MGAFFEIPGSARDAVAARRAGHVQAGRLNQAELQEEAEVTILLRENPSGPSLDETLDHLAGKAVHQRQYLDHGQLEAVHGFADSDRDAVVRWVNDRGMKVVAEDKATRRIRVRGTVQQLGTYFGVALRTFEQRDRDGHVVSTYRDHAGPVRLPAQFQGVVEHVLGLSTRPAARPRFVRLAPGAAPKVSYDMGDVAHIYDFPSLPNGGAGMEITIGIAELGGAVNQQDLTAFKQQFPGLSLVEEGVDGATPTPDPQGADIEVALDWQGIAKAIFAVAPQVKLNIVVKYGPNTDQGFVDVEAAFASDGRNYYAVSTSWGERKDQASAATVAAMDASVNAGVAKGITYTFAAGDNGSNDTGSFQGTDQRLIPDWPSTCVRAVGVGGTTLTAQNGVRQSETVWNEQATGHGEGGGGVDVTQPVPAYQSDNGITPVSQDPQDQGKNGRGTPDITFVADPETGVNTVYGGQTMVVGGTSYGAPATAALYALIAALNGKGLGEVNPAQYALAKGGKGFNDITEGSNNSFAPTGPYTAGPGWDAASGLGSPRGQELAGGLAAQAPTPGKCPPKKGKGHPCPPHKGGHGHHGHGL